MANLITAPTFFPRRLSSYVPAMQYASDVNISGESRISFGSPGAANATYYTSGLSVSAAGVTQGSAFTTATADAPYGRNVSLILSGAGTGTVIVDGYDYLMQPMSENLSLNGTTAVNGQKAFYTIRQITYPTVGAVTMNVGTGTRLGLPYKAGRVLTEEAAQLPVSTGTLINPTITYPATATTGDPRGSYVPGTTPNGTTLITATFEFYNDVDANNNGGLHGVPHYTN